MNITDILHVIKQYVLDNLPTVVGVGIATIVLTLIGLLFKKPAPKIPPPPKNDDDVISQYIADLIRRGSTLSFGDPASWSVTNNDNEGLVTLEQIWTPLRVADSQTRKGKTGTHESMAEKDIGFDLHNLFDSTNQSLLILGDPGSGKSTSLAMLSVATARARAKDKRKPIPIWVNLAAINSVEKNDNELFILSGVSEVGLAATRGPEKATELLALLKEAIVQGRALVLLDGLDEVKAHLLSKVRNSISSLLGLQNGTRVIVTCRKFDYRQSSPNRKVSIERELEILPYSPDEQQQYIDRWYAAAVRIGRFNHTQAKELSDALIQEIHNENIAELAESPLLLALLTLIHSEEAKLPDSRAVVCDRAITYMLADAAKWRVREAGSSTLATPPVLALAIEIAYWCQCNEMDPVNKQNQGVTVELVNKLAKQICENMTQAESANNGPIPEELSQRFLKSHGLLLDYGNGFYKFAHRSFQEFLAGQYYAAGAHHSEALSRGSSIHWREPLRLMASFAGHEGENLYYILTLIDQLICSDTSPIASIQLGAEMLTEIGRRRIALHHFNERLLKGGLWDCAQTKISSHVENPNLTLSERERSATIIGYLGDSRFVTDDGLTGPWTHLVDVLPGNVIIGSNRLDPELVTKSGGFLGLPRTLDFGPIKVGRYPITNAEFRQFINGGGYTNMDYWPGMLAHGWVTGDQNTLKTIREHWISKVYEHHAKEIRDGEIDTKRLEEESIKRTAPRGTPYYWLDRRFNRPNQPVVGINYWESVAFCLWATQEGHKNGRLAQDYVILIPTEFEWEHASRPNNDDRIYPWGDKWAEDKAHVSTNTLNMRQPAPVGIYLESWPGGPCEMAGNVWEWTASIHFRYSEEFDKNRISDESLEERIVRGSSWYNNSIVAACSARCVDRSYNLFYDVGFRIVCMHKDQKRTGSF